MEQEKLEKTVMESLIGSMAEFVCGTLCRYNDEAKQQGTTCRQCPDCRMADFTYEILNTHSQIKNLTIEGLCEVVEQYRKIVPCRECLYRAKDRDEQGKYYWCRNDAGKRGRLPEHDGCSSGVRIFGMQEGR